MNLAWHLPTPAILSAVLLDLAFGDPAWMPHPVRLIGAAIAAGERMLWSGSPAADLRRGALLALTVIVLAGGAAWMLVALGALMSAAVGAAIAVVLAWTSLAWRGLDTAAGAVAAALGRDDLAAARDALPALVGRDPASLDREGIVRAVIESIAENCSDAVIAPMLYLFIGGPAAAIVYKAINTLDSMIGHTDARYFHFGRWAARLDDGANLIPARLTAGCIIAAAAVLRGSWFDALRTCQADARRHPSPNAGFPEAAMAGALGIQLGGPAVYDGEVEARPRLGAANREVSVADIASARWMLWGACMIALLAMVAGRMLLRPLWT